MSQHCPKKTIMIILGVLLLTTSGWSTDLDTIITAAVENNESLKSLILQLQNSETDQQIANLSKGYSLSLSTDKGTNNNQTGATVSYSSSSPEGVTVTASPTATFSLDDPAATEFSLSVPFNYNLVHPNQSGYQPEISIKQPLHDILGFGEDNALTIAQNEYSIDSNRVSLFKKVYEIELEVLAQLENLYTNRKNNLSIQANISAARETLETIQALGSYQPGSYEYRQSEFNLTNLEQQLDQNELEYSYLLKLLSLYSGTEITKLPILDSIELTRSSTSNNTTNPDIYLAAKNLALAELELEKELAGTPPELYGTGSYSFDVDSGDGASDYDFAAGVSTVFEDFSLSTSVGYIFDSQEPYLSAAFSWTLPDHRDDALREKKLVNSVEIAELQLKTRIQELQKTELNDALNLAAHENDRENITTEIEILKQKVREKEFAYQNGFSTKTIVEQAEMELQIKELELTILTIQEMEMNLNWEMQHNYVEEK